MNYYLDVLRKYAVFGGRARRREYWFFALFNLIASAVLGLLDNLLGTPMIPLADFALPLGMTGPGSAAVPEDVFTIGLLSLLYGLAVFIPGLAVTVRRLHDVGRSGWWLLLAFVPVVGGIVLFVFTLIDSQPGENRYGPNPKGEGSVAAFEG